jgi:hypothetical protein
MSRAIRVVIALASLATLIYSIGAGNIMGH